jgi:hypothetical protein
MSVNALTSRPSDPVKQFSIFTENKLGRLNEIIGLLAGRNVHVLALTTLDTTDSTILRVVVDDPDAARDLLRQRGFAFTECDLLVVEIDSENKLKGALSTLVMAEINIHYVYSFIAQPDGRAALAMHLEDREVASQALRQHQFKVLEQRDLSR